MHLLNLLLLGLLLVGVAIALWVMPIYNRLIVWKRNIFKSWDEANDLLKQRHELLPELIETVSPFVEHKKELLESIGLLHSHIETSTEIENTQEMQIRVISELTLGALLRQLFISIENYNELKASSKYRNLHRTLVELEYAFQIERRSYNSLVRNYNMAISIAPDAFVARLCKLKPLPLFKQGKSGNHVSYGNTTLL